MLLCSAQDLFNFLTRGSTVIDKTLKIIKNVDDFCLFDSTLKYLENQIKKLMNINLKLSPSKFKLSTAVKFGGTVISRSHHSFGPT